MAKTSRQGCLRSQVLLVIISLCFTASTIVTQTTRVAWRDCLNQKAEWYGSAEAVRIADNLLLFQRGIGGWQKNVEMAKLLSAAEKADATDQKEQNDATIDNGATYTQMIYLARVFNATRQERFKEAFIKGLDYLLKAQYANGGWPQYYPRLTGYYKHITFNDDAMVGVMSLLREIARKQSAYVFVDDARRSRSEQAVSKGIECILKSQIIVSGKRTAWCAQHDEVTLAPADARAYEKISLSGGETVGIIRFLMTIDRPSPRVVEAIQSAIVWLEQVKLTGIKVVEKQDSSLPNGLDRVVVQDSQAEPLWARFYEIGTNRPIFCGRDGVIKYSLAEIEHERRTGYRWYVNSPAKLLIQDYPAWQKKWAASLKTEQRAEATSDDQAYYLFTSFRGNGQDGLHFAMSRDGYRWTILDQDRSYLKPVVGKGQLMRDPCLVQGPDGTFHMVWTTGWYDQTIGYSSSKDLIHWSEQQALPVMAHEPTARNAWAPELFYDEAKKQWLIFWATTIPGKFPETDNTGNNALNHRIYYVTTKDFKTFSAAKLFFDPGFNVIDATLIKAGQKHYLIFKDERQNPVKKNLRLAVAESAEGPYQQVSEAFTKDWVEGPTAIKIGDEWLVYFDEYRDHHYGAVKSKDLKQWQDISGEMIFPKDHRHGSVLKITKALAEGLSR